jgi:hypothetical protein
VWRIVPYGFWVCGVATPPHLTPLCELDQIPGDAAARSDRTDHITDHTASRDEPESTETAWLRVGGAGLEPATSCL